MSVHTDKTLSKTLHSSIKDNRNIYKTKDIDKYKIDTISTYFKQKTPKNDLTISIPTMLKNKNSNNSNFKNSPKKRTEQFNVLQTEEAKLDTLSASIQKKLKKYNNQKDENNILTTISLESQGRYLKTNSSNIDFQEDESFNIDQSEETKIKEILKKNDNTKTKSVFTSNKIFYNPYDSLKSIKTKKNIYDHIKLLNDEIYKSKKQTMDDKIKFIKEHSVDELENQYFLKVATKIGIIKTNQANTTNDSLSSAGNAKLNLSLNNLNHSISQSKPDKVIKESEYLTKNLTTNRKEATCKN